ncbi:MAG: phosphatase PAP2 family protein [Gammaproteobacteria bacterium]|jgi:membrane-associated phospholipid phosphatase|nr:phosphatase PAP2 family protein [Gammaproteobacteria bacterium]
MSKQIENTFQFLKTHWYPCTIGLFILASHMGLYFLLISSGLASILPATTLSILLDWMLWDPKLIIVSLQSILLSFIAAGTALYEKDWQGLKQLITIQISVGVITEFLKRTVQRLRPNGADYKSFPSGHSSATFAAAAFVHQRYGLKKAIPAYMCASMVGCIRVYKQAHYPTDVFAGAAIAILTAYNLSTEKPATQSAPKQQSKIILAKPKV